MGLAQPARMPAALLPLALLLIAAVPARAAYAPALEVRLNPPVAGVVPEIAASLTQTSLEPATRRFTLRFPPGFVVNRSLSVAPCSADDIAARSCPPTSRIGRIDARASAGSVAGALYLARSSGGRAAIAGWVGGAGLTDNAVTGTFKPGMGDTLDISLDGLPPVPLLTVAVILDGGDLGLVRTPPDCGSWNVTGDFTSWQGDLAVAVAPVSASLCEEDPVVISRVGLSPRRFRVARTAADEQRPAFGTVLSWRLSRATAGTRVAIERRAGSRWQRVGSVIGAGDAGLNTLIFSGRLRGRPLRPGAYRFVLAARGGSAGAGIGFTVFS